MDSNDFTKNVFTGMPLKNIFKDDTKYIIVSDFFQEQLIGGAELTLEAIIKKCPDKFEKIQSQNLSPEMIRANINKHWIIGNFANISGETLRTFVEYPNVKYSFIEFDFKYCVFRSPFKHFLETGKGCDCPTSNHGTMIRRFLSGAKKVFWMSEKQKEHYAKLWPEVGFDKKHLIQSSTFTDDTISKLVLMKNVFKNSQEKKDEIWAIQASNSWIKGTQQTTLWAQNHNLKTKQLGNMPYDQFLVELAKCYGLLFRPASDDTCPRIVIEAKLMGLELKMNNFVMHKDESWFAGTIEDCEKYLRTRADYFWTNIINEQ